MLIRLRADGVGRHQTNLCIAQQVADRISLAAVLGVDHGVADVAPNPQPDTGDDNKTSENAATNETEDKAAEDHEGAETTEGRRHLLGKARWGSWSTGDHRQLL